MVEKRSNLYAKLIARHVNVMVNVKLATVKNRVIREIRVLKSKLVEQAKENSSVAFSRSRSGAKTELWPFSSVTLDRAYPVSTGPRGQNHAGQHHASNRGNPWKSV